MQRQLTCGMAIMILGVSAAMAGSAGGVWPGTGACSRSLQECIDSREVGDTIWISTDGPIAIDGGSDLFIRDSLSLRASFGYKPTLTLGKGISAISDSDTFNVTIEGLTFSDDLIMIYRGAGIANFVAKGNKVTGPRGISVSDEGTGQVDALISENELTIGRADGDSFSGVAISVGRVESSLTAEITHNRISVPTGMPGAVGINLANVAEGASLVAAVGFNELRGPFVFAGISTPFSSETDSSVDARIHSNAIICGGQGNGFQTLVRNELEASFEVINNTITQCQSGIRFSHSGISLPPEWDIEARVDNNLVAYNEVGIAFEEDFDEIVRDSHNLLFANGANDFSAAATTIFADPKLRAPAHPFLTEDSPAIDAGSLTAGFLQGFAGLDNLDLAGMRRLNGPGLDIGAYEYGDFSVSHAATSASISGNQSEMEDLSFEGDAEARLIVTPRFNPGLEITSPLGLFQSSGRWSVFFQDFVDMLPGMSFNIFDPGDDFDTESFLLVSEEDAIEDNWVVIDRSSLNNEGQKFLLATQRFGGTFNAHPIAVSYDFTDRRWRIYNIDGAEMESGVGFNVYAQDLSPNAFSVRAVGPTTFGSAVRLDHPLLNGTPCAKIHVTRNLNFRSISSHFDVEYDPAVKRWEILDQGDGPIGSYFVLVNPAQVFECSDTIFENGFE